MKFVNNLFMVFMVTEKETIKKHKVYGFTG